MEQEGKLRSVVTQNIDGLHQAAGSKRVHELHGSVLRNHCMKCGLSHVGFKAHLKSLWASLVAQMVKNPPAMWETWVRSLCWHDPLEEGMATHSSILA